MTVYNGAAYIGETLASVLDQDFADFALVVLDDCSQDESPEILKRIAQHRKNVYAYRNLSRKGMVGTWVDVFRLSRLLVPEQKYFAWCADHDLLSPNWLNSLAAVLDNHPEAVVAYPLTAPVDRSGRPIDRPTMTTKDRFDTEGHSDPIERVRIVNREGRSFGNIIYGLMRSDALAHVGIYRNVLKPDRLAAIELSLIGEIHQVPEPLRLRRTTSSFSLSRQKTTLFAPGKRPWSANLPWWAVHAVSFFRSYIGVERRPKAMSPVSIGLISLDLAVWPIKTAVSGYPGRMKKGFATAMKKLRSSMRKVTLFGDPKRGKKRRKGTPGKLKKAAGSSHATPGKTNQELGEDCAETLGELQRDR